MKTIRRARPFFFPALILGLVVGVWAFRAPLGEAVGSPERLEVLIERAGRWAPAAVVVLQFLQVVLFVIPGEVVQIAAGYLYGIGGGVALSLAGILAGSIVNFLIGRTMGVSFVQAIAPRQMQRFNAISSKPVTQAGFFLLFLVPGFPKDFLCYVAGISTIAPARFLFISTAGRLPGIVGSAVIGHSAASDRPVLSLVILSIAGTLTVTAVLFRESVHRYIVRRFTRKTPE